MPLYVRAAALGAHSLHFVFCYQPLHTCTALKRRLCPLSANLRVQPSLNVQCPETRLMAGEVPEPHIVTEDGQKFRVFTQPRGRNHGLFLDMAYARA